MDVFFNEAPERRGLRDPFRSSQVDKNVRGSWSNWLAMETLLLSPPEIPGKIRPPMTLWATWVRLNSAITADTWLIQRSRMSQRTIFTILIIMADKLISATSYCGFSTLWPNAKENVYFCLWSYYIEKNRQKNPHFFIHSVSLFFYIQSLLEELKVSFQ